MRKPTATGLLIAAALVFLSEARNIRATQAVERAPIYDDQGRPTFDDFVAAIHQRESSSRVGRIYGDGGRSFGPLQISYKAWTDAVRFDKTIGGKYSDCKDLEYSKRVMRAYLERYDAKALARGDWEACARLWNSGPGWRSKLPKTNQYWAAVRSYLDRLEEINS